jgi:probable F420-dependent oxidoreductase
VKIRIGVGLGTAGWALDERFGQVVVHLERLGFDSLWLSERLSSPTVDPVVGLAYAAGVTRRLKLGTSVLVLPGRNPAVLAKELASLDRLSAGRLLPAFGLGVVDAVEQQVFGVARRERGPWLEEALPLLRRFWSEDEVSHAGRFFRYERAAIRPRPSQTPIDIWLGGQGTATLRRAGRLADGWLPSLITPSEAAAGRSVVEAAASDSGRTIDPEHFGAIVQYARRELPPSVRDSIAARRPGLDPAMLVPLGLPAARETLQRFVDVGVSKFVVRPVEEPISWSDELETLAEELLPLQV